MSSRATPYRLMRRIFYGLAGLCFVSKLATAAGAPDWLLTCSLVLTAVAAVVTAVLGRNQQGWLDGWRLVLVLTGLWFYPSVYSYVRGDGVEYYVLARSPLFDGDFDFTNDFDALEYRAVSTGEGVPASRVQFGLGLLWMPFLLIAHLATLVASWLGAPVEADGFSAPYQAAVTSATYLYGFAALVLLEQALRRYYGPAVALVSVLALWLATPLYFYTVANPFMSHGATVFAATLFVLSWLRARNGDDRKAWLLTGAAGGLMCLIRAHHSLLLVLPLVDLVLSKRDRLGKAAAYLSPPFVLAVLQAALWWALFGSGFANELAGMNLLVQVKSHLVEILLSPRHGLFTWTPLYFFAAIGWGLWLRRDRRLALLLFAGFLLSAYVNSLFVDWWGSDSFGQRRLLALTPFFALGLGEMTDFARRRPLLPVTCILAVMVVWNMQFAYIYNSELVAQKNQAVNLEQLTQAQIEVAFRGLVRQADKLPPYLWALLYDNLKGIWLIEGNRSLKGRIHFGETPAGFPLLFGPGWYGPERDEGTSFRRSRGRRSWLRIPIRRPMDFRVLLRARLELTTVGKPVELELAVNEQPVGTVELRPGWNDYHFTVPADLLEPGLNSFLLTYSATPRQADAEFHGRNTVVAVESMKFELQSN